MRTAVTRALWVHGMDLSFSFFEQALDPKYGPTSSVHLTVAQWSFAFTGIRCEPLLSKLEMAQMCV
jgi:hypothetical protein